MMTRTNGKADLAPRQRRKDAKLAEILAAAWDLARRDGLTAISLRDLAQRVDLRQPSLYAYFESKHDLYDLMFADGNRQLLEAVRELEAGGDPRERLIAFVRRLTQFSTDDLVRHQLLFQRTIPGFEPSTDSYRLALDFFALGVAHLAAAGITDPGDIDVFTALVSGLGHQQIANDPGGDRWVRLSERAVDMFLADVDRRKAKTERGTA